MYEIQPYSYKKAKELGYTIQSSHKPKNKIDVFKNNIYLFSIGAIGYSDFPTYAKEKGLEYALERRRLYHIRHKKDTTDKGQASLNILW